jgi:hypothetical protein
MANAQLKLGFMDDFNEAPSKEVSHAIEKLAAQGGIDDRGAVFTRREVVDFLLNLIGYTSDKVLSKKRILEPSFGGGDFLFPIVERLLGSTQKLNSRPAVIYELINSIRAVELHKSTFEATREKLINILTQQEISSGNAILLTDSWLVQGDFLIEKIDGIFDFVVGNPPYVRQELIPPALLQEYRKRFQTMYDRADLYIPFIERSLGFLHSAGVLGFICSDRWMKNKYGGPLREMISKSYRLKVYVDMVNTPAFHSDVIAYPAITVLTCDKPGPTRIVSRPKIEHKHLNSLASELNLHNIPAGSKNIREIEYVQSGSEPWMLGSSTAMNLVRDLEKRFPTLEQAFCKVGIGVATGADKEFIGNYEELDVEPDRKVPLVTTKDILEGVIKWSGKGVINPFQANGQLVKLSDYPRLRKYLEHRKDVIAGRHCAQKTPENWYRTIDRISPELTSRHKLLIPDINGQTQIVLEKGKLYPHHNLYYIVSEKWDLRALQAVLLSGIARLFISSYSTEMRGGFLRYQAQYLRRIRIPYWSDVPQKLRDNLIDAGTARDVQACSQVSSKLFGCTSEHWAKIET